MNEDVVGDTDMAGPDFFTAEWLDQNPQMGPAIARTSDTMRMRPERGMQDDARALIVVRVDDDGMKDG